MARRGYLPYIQCDEHGWQQAVRVLVRFHPQPTDYQPVWGKDCSICIRKMVAHGR